MSRALRRFALLRVDFLARLVVGLSVCLFACLQGDGSYGFVCLFVCLFVSFQPGRIGRVCRCRLSCTSSTFLRSSRATRSSPECMETRTPENGYCCSTIGIDVSVIRIGHSSAEFSINTKAKPNGLGYPRTVRSKTAAGPRGVPVAE